MGATAPRFLVNLENKKPYIWTYFAKFHIFRRIYLRNV